MFVFEGVNTMDGRIQATPAKKKGGKFSQGGPPWDRYGAKLPHINGRK